MKTVFENENKSKTGAVFFVFVVYSFLLFKKKQIWRRKDNRYFCVNRTLKSNLKTWKNTNFIYIYIQLHTLILLLQWLKIWIKSRPENNNNTKNNSLSAALDTLFERMFVEFWKFSKGKENNENNFEI